MRPPSAAEFRAQALAALAEGRTGAAESLAREAVAAASDDPAALAWCEGALASVLSAQRRHVAAMELFSRALAAPSLRGARRVDVLLAGSRAQEAIAVKTSDALNIANAHALACQAAAEEERIGPASPETAAQIASTALLARNLGTARRHAALALRTGRRSGWKIPEAFFSAMTTAMRLRVADGRPAAAMWWAHRLLAAAVDSPDSAGPAANAARYAAATAAILSGRTDFARTLLEDMVRCEPLAMTLALTRADGPAAWARGRTANLAAEILNMLDFASLNEDPGAAHRLAERLLARRGLARSIRRLCGSPGSSAAEALRESEAAFHPAVGERLLALLPVRTLEGPVEDSPWQLDASPAQALMLVRDPAGGTELLHLGPLDAVAERFATARGAVQGDEDADDPTVAAVLGRGAGAERLFWLGDAAFEAFPASAFVHPPLGIVHCHAVPRPRAAGGVGEVLVVAAPPFSPNPGRAHVAAEIAAAGGAAGHLLAGEGASVAEVVSALRRRPGRVHIIAHGATGVERPSSPLDGYSQSAIRLADGELDAATVARLDLEGIGLVVLSSCSSGRGPALFGEGAASLGAGFLDAGVGWVIAALWPVDDEQSSNFLRRLYLRDLRDPAAALESVRREASLTGAPRSNWAAWTCFG